MADAGWYKDPTGEDQLRYFDGSQWTEEVAANPERSTPDLSDFFTSDNTNNVPERDMYGFLDSNNYLESNYGNEENGEIEEEFQSTPRAKGGVKKKILPITMILLLLIVVYGKISQDKAINKPFPANGNKEITNSSSDTSITPIEKVEPDNIANSESDTNLEENTTTNNSGERVGDEVKALDLASSKFLARIKGTGVVVTHLNSGISTEVTLNPNGTLYLNNSKGSGVGDSKHLYLKTNLFLAYDGGKVIDKLVKNRGYSWVRLSLSNTQTGITFYSGKYYDGSNIAKFWSYLKRYRSGMSTVVNSSGEREISVESLGGNDWATFYLDANNNFTKVVIDGDTDISTIVTVKGNGKKAATIPSSGYINF